MKGMRELSAQESGPDRGAAPTSCPPGLLVPVSPAWACAQPEQGGGGARSHSRFTFRLPPRCPQAKSLPHTTSLSLRSPERPH